jgi:hypothetical protein
MKRLIIGTVLLLVVGAEIGYACSLSSMELRQVSSDLSILITHKDKPIAGIQVQVVPYGKQAEPLFTALSDERGTVQIRGLAVGTYYLIASHLGFVAGKEWIEVVATPDEKTLRRFEFQWADYSYEVRQVEGTLTGFVLGDTGNKLMDLVHQKEVPHARVDLRVQDAFSDEKHQTTSDSNGFFAIGPLPSGTYLLTISGGAKTVGGVADETRLIVDLIPSAKLQGLRLKLLFDGCGRFEYELK